MKAPVHTAALAELETPIPLEEIAERSRQHLAFDSGRRVIAERAPEGDRLRVEAPGGEVELTVTFTPAGPLLRFRGADVELVATRTLAVTCERFELQAGDAHLEATRGDLVLEANDDVHVLGERVKLNC